MLKLPCALHETVLVGDQPQVSYWRRSLRIEGILFRDTIKLVHSWKSVETRYTVQEELTEWTEERNSQVCDAEIP